MPTNSYSIDLEKDSVQYLTAADSASLSTTGNFTIAGWLNYESFTGTPLIWGKTDLVNGARSWYLLHYSATNNLQAVTSSDGTAETSGANVAWSRSNATWYHFAGVYTASAGAMEFYIDGTSIGSSTGLNTSIHDNASLFRFGWTASGNAWDGLYDETGLWSRALSATEIGNLYNRNNTYCALISTDANLSAFWNFNNVLTDSSGNGNTLTETGGAVFSTTVPFASDTCGVVVSNFLLMGV